MAFGNTADLIFKIKADSQQAEQRIAAFKKDLKDMQRASKEALSPLQEGAAVAGLSAQQFQALKTGVLAATAAFAAVGAAAIAVSRAIFNLTADVAAAGSKVQDLADKTSLSASTISALQYAAEQSGTSIDALVKGFNRFNVQLGEAALGSPKAIEKLKDLGITSTNTDKALGQLIDTLQKTTDQQVQMTLASEALGKKAGPELVTMIRQGSGSLEEMRETVKRLGIGFDNDGARKAKQFDDQLLELKQVARGVSIAFAVEVMPSITDAMANISRAMQGNRAVAADWGKFTNDVIRGLEVSMTSLAARADYSMGAINDVLRRNIGVVIDWRFAWLSAMGVIGQTLAALAAVGRENPGVVRVFGEDFETTNIPRPGAVQRTRGGGGGGASGSNAKAEAERRERERIQAIMRNLSDELELRRAHDDKLQAELDAKLAREEITEEQALQKRRLIILAQLEFQRQALEDSANLIGENAEEYERIQRQLRVLAEETTTAQIEQSTKLYLLQKSLAEKTAAEVKAIFERLNSELIQANDALQAHYIESEERTWDELIANAVGFADEQNRIRAEAGDALELILRNELQRQLRRLDTEKERRLKDAAEQIKDKEQLEQAKLEIEELFRKRSELLEEEFQKRLKKIREKYAFKVTPEGDKKSIFGLGGFGEELEALGKNAFGAFANGIGSVVEQFVLLGKVGPDAMRKLTASVLAGLAAQAAVKSLFYLAEGFAALFTNPAQAAGYFKAAALMAIVAATAGAAGRAIAGNAFQQGTGGGAGTGRGGVAAGNGSDFDALSGGVFRGFGQAGQGSAVRRLEATLDRLDRTVAVTEKTIHDFATKVNGVSPGDVVMMGATDASREIRRAMENELANDSGTTDSYMRGMGLAR